MRSQNDLLRSSKKIKRKRLIKNFFLSLFIIIAIFSLLIAFLNLPYFKIKKISLTGNKFIETGQVMDEVNSFLSQKKFFFLPEDNIIFASKEELAQRIFKKFPRIKNLSIKKSIFNGLSIEIEERQQEALLCNNKNPSQCAFIDKDGYVFESSPYFSDNLYLKFFDNRNSSSDLSSLGFQLLSADQFKKLIEFKNDLSQEKINILKISLEDEGVYRLSTDAGWLILINEKNDPQKTFDNLKLVLEKIGDKKNILDYIDLRFGNKVYYKFR